MPRLHSNEIGKIVREYRIKKGWSQINLARALGYDQPQFVSFFERGLSKVPIEVLGRLIVVLEIPEAKIMKVLISAYDEKISSEISAGKIKAQKVG